MAWRLDLHGDEFAFLEIPLAPAACAVTRRLTRAEADVAALVLAGLPNGDIARLRATSPRTVANQVASIFRKLGVRSRLELCAAAARAGRDGGNGGAP